jgi:2-polyprenyl-3-methyl-5-hydroxy-6-metoxy-1,4-benzoquinol methylase
MRNRERITNPIFKELLELKIVSKKNIVRLSTTTRDKKIPVYKDLKSGVIFLKKYLTNTKYYEAIKYKDDIGRIIKKSNRKISLIKTLKGNIESTILEDDKRRIFQFKKNLKNKKILDFGCGWGGFLNGLKKIKSLTGVELRNECINFIKKNLKKISVTNNINNLREKYNIITLFHVLEHIPHQVQTLKMLKSKLLKKGKIIIEVPSAQDFLLNLDGFNDFKKFTFWSEHLILHTENSLKKILNKAGFKKIKIQYYQRYNFSNHLGWFIKKKPGGHISFKHLCDKKINESYIDYLKRIKRTDTLIAVANK